MLVGIIVGIICCIRSANRTNNARGGQVLGAQPAYGTGMAPPPAYQYGYAQQTVIPAATYSAGASLPAPTPV